MKKHKIAVIAGDGIGPEVLAEGVRGLKQVAECDGGFSFEFTFFPWGCEYYLKTGKMMDEDGIEKLKQYDAIFLGAVGYPGVPDHISLWDLLLNIRKSFDQYVNLRPVRLLEGAPCPLKDVDRKGRTARASMRGAAAGCLRENLMKSCFRKVCFPGMDVNASSVMPMIWQGKRARP